MRNRLFSDLADMLKLSLYPDKFLTQEAIAESAMVGWLTFGTELGRVPDEIELMKVIPVDTETEDGYLDFYVYRFRTYPPHWAADKGWIAGLAGPYLRKDAPSIRSYGYTFSAFEAWDARTPEDHVGNITEIIESWKEYRERKK